MNNASRRGFVLGEVIAVLIMSTVLVATLLLGLVALVRGMQPRAITVDGEVLPVAPTFGAFPSAIRWHRAFSDQVLGARAVYVFGGAHLSIPGTAPETEMQPLKGRTLPVISDFSRGLPMDAKSFYDLYADALGEQEVGRPAGDFAVICVGPANGTLAVTCLAQVCGTGRTISDGTTASRYTLREAALWTISEPPQRYAFLEPTRPNAPALVGAVHTWMRYRAAAVNEEGPTCLFFPDPWLFLGGRGEPNDIPPFSRFSYFVAVAP